MDWWKGISPIVLISFIYWWKGISPVVLIYFIYMFISSILEKLNRWKGNNNHSFVIDIKRLREQNVWHQDYLYISITMKITEYRKTADNIISNKTIHQMRKRLFHPIQEQHSIGGTTLDNDHIGPTYLYHQHCCTWGLQHLLAYLK